MKRLLAKAGSIARPIIPASEAWITSAGAASSRFCPLSNTLILPPRSV